MVSGESDLWGWIHEQEQDQRTGQTDWELLPYRRVWIAVPGGIYGVQDDCGLSREQGRFTTGALGPYLGSLYSTYIIVPYA